MSGATRGVSEVSVTRTLPRLSCPVPPLQDEPAAERHPPRPKPALACLGCDRTFHPVLARSANRSHHTSRRCTLHLQLQPLWCSPPAWRDERDSSTCSEGLPLRASTSRYSWTSASTRAETPVGLRWAATTTLVSRTTLTCGADSVGPPRSRCRYPRHSSCPSRA